MEAAVIDAGLASSPGAASLVGDAVRSWRCANRGKALPPLEERTGSAPTTLTALVRAGTLDFDARVRFVFTVTAHRLVPIAEPHHKFLESVAIPAFALADAYNIEVLPVGWPYWNLTFPGELTDGEPGSTATMVCGEHELRCVITDRVRQHQLADEVAAALMEQLGRPLPSPVVTRQKG